MARPEVLLSEGPILTGVQRRDATYRHARPGGSDDWLIFCTIAGAGLLRGGREERRTVAGELAAYAPRQPQDYRTDPAAGMWEFAWAHVHARPAWIPWLAWPQRAPGLRILAVPDPAAFAAIAARFQEAHHHACSARHHRHELALNALEEVLLRADEHNAASPAGRDGRLDPRLRAAIDRCLRDLAAPWDIARLAQAAGLSPSRFAHLFRSELGESPRRFLERHRIDRARHLLRATAAPVAGIAHEVGFPDPFHFSIRFRACTGRSPSAWRAGA